ncbi:MAG: hypothetical protein IPI49_19665 [Myxococcales bacterium]|nr:hypothetical protein [Myxococcales bacterium]
MPKPSRPSRGPRDLFCNRLYTARVEHTLVGSPVLLLLSHSAEPPRRRQQAAFIYELAADMERRSEELGASWSISPRPAEASIALELGPHDSREFADEFISTILAAHSLE